MPTTLPKIWVVEILTHTDLNANFSTLVAAIDGGLASATAWSSITGKPTTLTDYGITSSDPLLVGAGGGGGGTGMPVTGGTFTGPVLFRPSGVSVDTISLLMDGRLNLRASATGSTNAAPAIQFRVPVGPSEPGFVAGEEFVFSLYATGDRGVRFNYNYIEPAGASGTHFRSDRHQILTGMEQDGAWFIRYEKPFTVTGSTWDVGGKSLAIYAGGFNQGVGPSTTNALRTVDLCGMQAGRSIRIGASATAANPIFSAEFDPNGNMSTMGRLGLQDGNVDLAPVRFNSAAFNEASMGNGDLWFDGTNFKTKIGGVVKTFTVT